MLPKEVVMPYAKRKRLINFLISNSNALDYQRTCLFIVHLGITVQSKLSTVAMKRSTMDRFENIMAVRSRWTVWMKC